MVGHFPDLNRVTQRTGILFLDYGPAVLACTLRRLAIDLFLRVER